MFHAPPWGAPLDVDAVIAAIPKDATVKGVFLNSVATALPRDETALRRDRYLAFADYPLVELAHLLVVAADALFPALPVRQALRKMGRRTPRILLETTYGKVVFAGATEMHEVLEATAKAYGVMAGAKVTVEDAGEGFARIRLEDVFWFLDSNHVGVFEGLMKYCGVRGNVDIRLESPSRGEFALTWRAEPPPKPA